MSVCLWHTDQRPEGADVLELELMVVECWVIEPGSSGRAANALTAKPPLQPLHTHPITQKQRGCAGVIPAPWTWDCYGQPKLEILSFFRSLSRDKACLLTEGNAVRATLDMCHKLNKSRMFTPGSSFWFQHSPQMNKVKPLTGFLSPKSGCDFVTTRISGEGEVSLNELEKWLSALAALPGPGLYTKHSFITRTPNERGSKSLFWPP